MPRHHTLVIGHRGAPGYRPEHTRSSYDLALALGVDAVEPDVVFSRDGVLVVRHENEISSTTDVAARPEFADRRTTKTVDGVAHEGWFTEDFTWAELQTLRCRERLPKLRAGSASFDDTQPPLRLADVLALVRAASLDQGREIGVVLEIKHATSFGALGFDVAGTIAAELRAAGWADGALPLVIESFESTVLAQVRAHGIPSAPTYAAQAAPAGLDALVGVVDGISVDKRMILAPDRLGRATGPSRVVDDAHARGLRVFTWTCRPENAFLVPQFRTGRDKSAFGDYAAEWQIIADAGVDGVFADHPDLALAFFR